MDTMNLLSLGKCCSRQRKSLVPVNYSVVLRDRAHVLHICKLLASFAVVAACCLTAGAQSVTLAWNASTSVGVTGYKIYWGAASQAYTSTTNVGNVTQATVLGLV